MFRFISGPLNYLTFTDKSNVLQDAASPLCWKIVQASENWAENVITSLFRVSFISILCGLTYAFNTSKTRWPFVCYLLTSNSSTWTQSKLLQLKTVVNLPKCLLLVKWHELHIKTLKNFTDMFSCKLDM